jgi:RNA polymerase sigma-70 factor (ECF subfamily)
MAVARYCYASTIFPETGNAIVSQLNPILQEVKSRCLLCRNRILWTSGRLSAANFTGQQALNRLFEDGSSSMQEVAMSKAMPPAEVWVDQYGDLLYRYARVRITDRSDCEELVQETFLAALKGKENFKGQCEFATWLVGILKHKIMDHFRRQQRNQTDALPEDSVVEGMFNQWGKWKKFPRRWTVDPADSAMETELLPALQRCLEALPESQRQAFALCVMDEQKSGDVCKTLSVSATNLYVLLHRARLRMRDCLEKKGIGQSRAGEG